VTYCLLLVVDVVAVFPKLSTSIFTRFLYHYEVGMCKILVADISISLAVVYIGIKSCGFRIIQDILVIDRHTMTGLSFMV